MARGTTGEVETGRAPMRVILAGRTGLDSALRLDTGFELIRAPDAIEAIGELADPIDGASSADAVVIVGPDADPGSEADRFVAALGAVNPSVRTMIVGGSTREVYDAAIEPGTSPDALREMLRGGARPAQTGAPKAAQSRRPSSDPAPARRADGERDSGERELLGAMLTGRDIVPVAMARLRRLSGVGGAVFLPASAGQPDPSEVAGSELVEVAHGGRRHGWVRVPEGTGGRVAPHARTLAMWLSLAEQQRQLRLSAFTDDLTGAWNRRYFDRFLYAAIARARDERRALTILFFDIDDFKQYNDRHGHGAGDEILREVVRLLTSVIRPTDRVCRIGGDEFAVIFHEPEGPRDPLSKPPDSIAQLARRFQRQVLEHRFPKLGEQAPGNLTISGGLATYPWDGTTPEELIRRADELALESKRQGKNAILLGPGAQRVCGE